VSAESEHIAGSDEIAVRAHLASGRFLAGVAAKRWRLIDLSWPIAIIAIRAATRANSPDEWTFRFDLTGYKQLTPTAKLWDVTVGQRPADQNYPKGERVQEVIRPGLEYLYSAYDRQALAGHPEWLTTYARSAWNATRDLTFVLDKLSDLLTGDDYVGA
jgi:hypothetical protein